ncbi:hypothetical protein J3R83DRAFT_10533 [Lanmaoa asiatica]|nr:hypothetical protein J3R83DRAFT_10533 [Lanmaoa asiatica]
MQYMSEDDVAYSALLAQLLSDSASTRNARVHSWIEHQYDFALSEQPISPSSPPPSPSPSSSLGAHRTHSIDRPDSPLLPRSSSDRPSSPCPSYDALFFPPSSHSKSEDQDFEEQERVRALRFIVQEMAHWKSQTVPPSPPHIRDTPLPAPPPSPASSLTQSTSSRAMRSRSSSTRISRLPSFTSTLSSDQSQPQEIPPPLPVSVIVHGEYQHDLVLRHDRPFVDGYLHRRDDSFPLPLSQEQDGQFLCPITDDKDSVQPSPTLSNFSCAYSRETSFTTPYTSSTTSPTSIVFSSSPCSPENIALPASPLDDQPFFRDAITGPVHDRTPSYQMPPVPNITFPPSASPSSSTVSPPRANVFPAFPRSHSFPVANPAADDAPRRLRPPKLAEFSQSRWSVATTASLTPSNAEPKPSALLHPRTPPKEKKDKGLKTPKKRTRFISLISRFSPGRADASSTTTNSQTGDDVEYDSANDSDTEGKERNKQRKSLNKKSSLASLRASFSLSRASFNSQRPPPMSFSIEEVPPLPTSPTLTSPLADLAVPLEVVPPLPTASLSRISSRANLMNAPLPPIPQSASTITTFESLSQLSISDKSATSASDSRVSLVCLNSTPNASRISLLPAPSKRTSLASAAGVAPMVPANPVPTSEATARSKSIFRLTAKPKSLKTPPTPGTKGNETAIPSRLPITGHASLPSPTAVRSRIPQAPTKFNPPAKLATVIATQSQQAGLTSPTSKLPMPPSRPPPKIPRSITTLEKLPAENLPSLPPTSRLPMPASTKGTRVGTVKGFWKRQ